MPLAEADNPHFVARVSAVLRDDPDGSAINHLLLGDWLNFLGETSPDGEWVKVRCRGDTGWLRESDVANDRGLEVNFVDIGQGDGCHIVTPDDEVVLIDAGVGSNMNRFLSWRYNLRNRNVARADDFDANEDPQDPWLINHVVISHPDNDHYRGFSDVFENPKMRFENVFHNGIVERPIDEEDPNLTFPSRDDLGGYATDANGDLFVWDVVQTSDGMKNLVNAHPTTRKQYISTLRKLLENSPDVSFESLGKPLEDVDGSAFMQPFDDGESISLEVLGPLLEPVTLDGEERLCLRKLGNEGVTKNGHSVVLKLVYNELSVMLGGDLNTESQDFLMNAYTDVAQDVSSLEETIAELEAKGSTRDDDEDAELADAIAKINSVVAQARPAFECDVTKACHHGSAHFSDTFLQVVNAVATVISSGDEESHSHPRPDALGAFGKHGRGRRPLIFSTELARSTREFTPVKKYLDEIRALEEQLEAESDEDVKKAIEQQMENRKDRNVAVYGMITLRALGETVILAQKLEEPRSAGAKWDIYELHLNEHTNQYEYDTH